MLIWALTFLLMALLAWAAGFGSVGLAAVSPALAQTFFFVFATAFTMMTVLAVLRGKAPPE